MYNHDFSTLKAILVFSQKACNGIHFSSKIAYNRKTIPSAVSTCVAGSLKYEHFSEMKISIPRHPCRKAHYWMKVAAYKASQNKQQTLKKNNVGTNTTSGKTNPSEHQNEKTNFFYFFG